MSSLRQFLEKGGRKKAMLIYGPPGTGKTSSVHMLARELQLEVIEVNASDFRNKQKIDSIIGTASRQMSLFARGKVILVDEIDGLSGTKDRGGLQALLSVIEKTSHPMVLTALNPYDQKYSKLRSRCEMAEFGALGYTDIYNRLQKICNAEDIAYEEMALKSLARRAGGDLRAAINDLQSLSAGSFSLKRDDLDELTDRKQTDTIIDALVKILKTRDTAIALSALDNVDEDYDQLMLWLDENLPKEYKQPADLARAYDKLSKADVYSRRIRRWQHWRFLVYINALLTAGVAVSKDQKYKEFTQYGPTRRLLKIWMAKQKYAKRKAIAQKAAKKTHTSTRRALQDTVPYIQQIYRKGGNMSEFFEFNDDEARWLKS
jgi:replication factor C large subunit